MGKYYTGNCQMLFPDNYVLLDTETTGLKPSQNLVLEVGAVSVTNGEVDGEYTSLIKISDSQVVPSSAKRINHITTDMIRSDGLPPSEVYSELAAFIGNRLIVGYNVPFDLGFLGSRFFGFDIRPLDNDYVDIYRIANQFYSEEKNNGVADVLPRIGVDRPEAHRALPDCYDEKLILDYLKANADEGLIKFMNRFARKNAQSYIEQYEDTTLSYEKREDARMAKEWWKLMGSLISTNHESQTDGPLYNKTFCFTGDLPIPREYAQQIVKSLGGDFKTGVSKKVDFLVSGVQTYKTKAKDGLVSKVRDAQKLAEAGTNIKVISQDEFQKMLEEYND